MKSKKDIPSTSAAELLKAQSKSSSESRKSMPGSTSSTPPKVPPKKKKGKGRDSGTSSEEERWLDAIKSGKLEEVISQILFIFYLPPTTHLTVQLIQLVTLKAIVKSLIKLHYRWMRS